MKYDFIVSAVYAIHIYTYILVDNNLSVNEIMENESLFHDTTRQQSGVE